MKNKTCLDRAADLVTGDRQEMYGNPKIKYKLLAGLFTVLLGSKLKPGAEIEPADVVRLNLATKLGRLSMRYSQNDNDDLAGYARILEMVETDGEGPAD